MLTGGFLYMSFAFPPQFDRLWIGIVIVLSMISEFADWYHDTRSEQHRDPAISKVRGFILEMFAGTPVNNSPIAADSERYTGEEFMDHAPSHAGRTG